jgi:hypothetical protein
LHFTSHERNTVETHSERKGNVAEARKAERISAPELELSLDSGKVLSSGSASSPSFWTRGKPVLLFLVFVLVVTGLVENGQLLLDYPIVLFLLTLLLLWLATRVGAYFGKLHPDPQNLDHDDFSLILGATLTLLGLIIGFTFSMAVSRYDQRKNYEEQEANAIGTEYLRLDALPEPDAEKVRALLHDYVGQRIIYYTTRRPDRLRDVRKKTLDLQSNLWAGVAGPAMASSTPVAALVLSGMNDVLNSEGYSEAAWRNRVPAPAWILQISIAIFCNLVLGYRAHGKNPLLFWVIPVVLSTCFFLIADIESPRGGAIWIEAQNLQTVADSMRPGK